MTCDERAEVDFGDAYNACEGDPECEEEEEATYYEKLLGCCLKEKKTEFIAAKKECKAMEEDKETTKACFKEAKAAYETGKVECYPA